WVRQFDVDGFRLDAAWGVTERYPGFWPELRRALDRVKPHVFLLAEASARDPYYAGHGIDAAYDWNAELGHWAWQAAFENPARAGTMLRTAIESDAIPMHEVARFLDNNDTGKRFVTRYGLPTTRVA